MTNDIDKRFRCLEEKFLYQEQTIDALNEVILEQQEQLATLAEEINRLKTMLATLETGPSNGNEPLPPHY